LSYSNEKEFKKSEESNLNLVKNTAYNFITKQEYQTVSNESAANINENGLLKEFDQHSFPSINFVLLDNKLFVNNNKNLSKKFSTSQLNLNLKSSVLKVNLYSRKRHSFSSQSSSTCCFNFGLPQLVCNKSHYFQANEKMSEEESTNQKEHFVFKAKEGFLTNVLSNMNINLNQNSNPLFKHSKSNENNLPQQWSSSPVFMTPFTHKNECRNSMTPTSIFNTSLVDMQHENEPVSFTSYISNESVLSSFPTPSQSSADIKLAPKCLITTPTSFQMTPSSFFQTKNSYNISGNFDDTDDSNLTNSLICQSPKVLVSNHHFSIDENAKLKKSKLENHQNSTQINTGESNQGLLNENSTTNNLYLPNEMPTDCALKVSLADSDTDLSTKQLETNCSAHMLTSPTNNIQISMFKKCLKQFDDELVNDFNYNSSSYEEPLISMSSTTNSDFHSSFKNVQKSHPNQHFLFNSKRSIRANHALSSSPAPLRKAGTLLFDFDNSLKNPKSIKKYVT
jgi:hypothetical protein